MNACHKIALPPLEFEEFNALDILLNAEIGDLAYQARAQERRELDSARTRRLLERLRAVRAKVDAARPLGYAQAIKDARAETVCDT